jgi:hypothetical protein
MLMKGIAMDEDERTNYDATWDIPEDENDGYVTENKIDINDVLDGVTRLDFSHAGREFQHIMEEELHKQTRSHLHCSANLLFDRHHHVDPQIVFESPVRSGFLPTSGGNHGPDWFMYFKDYMQP